MRSGVWFFWAEVAKELKGQKSHLCRKGALAWATETFGGANVKGPYPCPLAAAPRVPTKFARRPLAPGSAKPPWGFVFGGRGNWRQTGRTLACAANVHSSALPF